jgi:hypothetical protein
MIVAQRFGRRKRRAHSHGAGVCMLFTSRLFGSGGASRRARNWRHALGLTANAVRSSSVPSATRSAASRTKSVRFLPATSAARSINSRTCGLMRRLSASRRADSRCAARIAFTTGGNSQQGTWSAFQCSSFNILRRNLCSFEHRIGSIGDLVCAPGGRIIGWGMTG